jgi:hypothetical protein
VNPRIVTLARRAGKVIEAVATAIVITVATFWFIVGIAVLAAHILGVPRR